MPPLLALTASGLPVKLARPQARAAEQEPPRCEGCIPLPAAQPLRGVSSFSS